MFDALVFGFRVFGFWYSGSGFRFSGFGFRVSGFGIRVSGFRFRVLVFGFRVSGFGIRVSGFGIGVYRDNAGVAELRELAHLTREVAPHLPAGCEPCEDRIETGPPRARTSVIYVDLTTSVLARVGPVPIQSSQASQMSRVIAVNVRLVSSSFRVLICTRSNLLQP